MNEQIDYSDLAKTFNEEINALQNATVKCAIIGRSGVGKSSLINAISGEKLAKVGVTETTMEIGEPYKNGRLWFYDLPGASTEKFPKSEYVEKMNIKEMDCVIFATSDRFYEDDKHLIEEINKLNIPIYLIRTKIDFSVDRGQKDNGHSAEETLQIIREDIESKIQDVPVEGLYLTSSDYPQKYELNKLLEDIYSKLDDIKRKRFLIDIAITSKSILKKKRILADDIVQKSSWAAAANGLNPIPGVDVAVDMGIIYKMSEIISKLFGLTQENLDFFNSLNNKNIKIVVAKASQYLIKYVGKEAIMVLLKKAATTLSTKTVVKYIPLFGQVVSASVGYFLTKSVGDDMVNNAESIAMELFETITNIDN